MSEPFVAEIKIWAGNFAPRGYAFCNGQILPISQNAALFSLLGTTYGGDGKTNFALPDLQARAPMHPGTGPGLSPRTLGEEGGSTAISLLTTEIPVHNHAAVASNRPPDQISPEGAYWTRNTPPLYNSGTNPAPMAAQLSPAGGGQAHNNLQPSLALSFVIALSGIFPQRP